VPELPDVDVYVDALSARIIDTQLSDIRIANPFLLRSVEPPLGNAFGCNVTSLRRIGKRIAIGLDNDGWLVLHLMIAGRLQWRDNKVALKGKHQLAAFDFEHGTMVLTEAGTRKRASLHYVEGTDSLKAHDPGGIEPLDCTEEEFIAALCKENHTIKRALTLPATIAGIGNAYSDEILHAARLSPAKQTQRLTPEEFRRLYDATRMTLVEWRERLSRAAGDDFPKKVTAFRPEMAAHGKFGKACPVCTAKIERIRYKSKETNYCPECQTGGRLLADRSLSRLLKDGWPNSR